MSENILVFAPYSPAKILQPSKTLQEERPLRACTWKQQTVADIHVLAADN